MDRVIPKFLTAVFVCMAVIAMMFSFAQESEAGKFKKEYKMTLNVGPQFYWGMGAIKFCELVKERTNGQINIKPYYGSALLKGAQLKSPQMVAKGVIDMAYESTINSASVIPEMNIFSLPFFINNFENLDKMEYGETGKAVFAAMEKKGLIGLGWGENGFRQVTNNKRPILMPDDLKGLKIRVVGSPIFIDIFKQLGADPVNMNWGDAVTGFQQGVVDGQENPLPGVAITVQIYQYHKYITRWNYLVDPVIIYWNKKQFEAFPADIQKAIRESAIDSARFEKALNRAGLDGDISLNILKNEFNHDMKIADPIKFAESKGMVVTNLTDAQRKAFADATKPLYKKWIPKIGEDLYKKAVSDMSK
ncbi:MAG: DctP family TRAP transporter solute-binding subunit [Thermodesulfobacteriota bacterium]